MSASGKTSDAVAPGRLASSAGQLAGRAIDRSKKLKFRLDGQTVEAFAGDTVLSAVLASGILAIGTHGGHPLALHERLSPTVAPRRGADRIASGLPMARMPAVDGADLVTLGRAEGAAGTIGGIRQRLVPGMRTLGYRFERSGDFVEPFRECAPTRHLAADVVVVGGGVAGMSAALALAGGGASVILVERRSVLGGDAPFYGPVEDEEPPDALVARLDAEIAASPAITVFRLADALAVEEGLVRVHLCEREEARAVGAMAEIATRLVVLATGTVERLPVFAGNRLPGVTGAIAAFQRARDFGLWSGRRSIFSTQNNFAYRLALMAGDAGIGVVRIADSRVGAQSRFIDFCKASGFTLAAGLMPHFAVPAPRGATGLSVGFAAAIQQSERAAGALECDGLVIAGSWQPDITLWCRAGGASSWNGRTGRLIAQGDRAGMVLAGSAAGLRNTSACLASGAAAAAGFFGKSRPAIDDTQIESIFETPDDPNPLSPPAGEQAVPAFLDVGDTLLTRPVASRPRLLDRLLRRPQPRWDPLAEGNALGLCDLVAAVHLKVVAADDAGMLMSERCLAPALIETGHKPVVTPMRAPGFPSFLADRFGPKSGLWIVLSDDSRFFDVGCLVFADAAHVDPALAIGVIVAPAPGRRSGGLALIGRPDAMPGERVSVRDENGPVSVRLLDRFRSESPLPAPPPPPAPPADAPRRRAPAGRSAGKAGGKGKAGGPAKTGAKR
jgi:sarcosine oxidase subunit alpha